jgi:hypothetical protein
MWHEWGRSEVRTKFWSDLKKEDNIRMDLRETEWEGVDWIHLAQDRYHWQDLVNTVINIRVTQKVGDLTS